MCARVHVHTCVCMRVHVLFYKLEARTRFQSVLFLFLVTEDPSVRDFRVNNLVQFSSYWAFGVCVEPRKDTKEVEAIFFFCTDIASKCGLFVVFQDNIVTHLRG